ncbi:fragmin60 [Marasmius fiardii PR-910]|nr:fragmin60 [Marasmius fiardii PR-910]
MALLTRPERYDIKDSNIALLGSDLEKHVREHAGDKESAWEDVGKEPGLRIWRIENFHVVPWPEKDKGLFYDGDSYIVLHTYNKTSDSDSLAYDLHFWLGENTTQDEAGTAAYKTVELDDHLHGVPVQYREVQENESDRFLSYFPKFECLKGGVATGFHHVTDPPPLDLNKLYRISASKSGPVTALVIREVAPVAANLRKGDVFVLDKGSKVLQFNTKASVGKEKFKAAEFVQNLVDARQGQCSVVVYDEGGSGAGVFLAEFGEGATLQPEEKDTTHTESTSLFRLSDVTGKVTFEQVEPATASSLHSSDVFLLDDTSNQDGAAVYVWLGRESSLNERRLASEYAQRFLHDKHPGERSAVPIIRMREGDEAPQFLKVMNS